MHDGKKIIILLIFKTSIHYITGKYGLPSRMQAEINLVWVFNQYKKYTNW